MCSMYLKSLTIKNFRKFGSENNEIVFAHEGYKGDEIKVEENESEERDNKEVSLQEFNVSSATTLIVGKNNVGKTSIVTAIKKLEKADDKFKATDFNYYYLIDLLGKYTEFYSKDEKETLNEKEPDLPTMHFKLLIKLDEPNRNISNISPILLLNKTDSAVLNVYIKLKDEEVFRTRIQKEIKKQNDKEKGNNKDNIRLKKLIEIIEDIGLKRIYKNEEDDVISNFNLKDLIEVKTIDANKVQSDNSLTDAFNKIIGYRFKNEKEINPEKGKELDKHISDFNESINKKFSEHHEDEINRSIGEIEPSDTLKVQLTSDLTFDKLLQNVLLYEYSENDLTFPENQYGLGYTNLIMTIAQIIEYIEKTPDSFESGRINLISIEEPEAYMHPQMQELFIKNINNALNQLFRSRNKNIRSQVIITTHSSHILNSKIHSGNTFDYINYCVNGHEENTVINLKDENIVSDKAQLPNRSNNVDKDKRRAENLKFIKKHIKYKVSELFFSDAVIFVEGVTEELLLNYWIEQSKELQKRYISIFNINGAYAHIYDSLIKELKIPTLIITDLDIKKIENKSEKSEKQESSSSEDNKENEKKDNLADQQVRSLKDKTTTNETLKFYIQEENLQELISEIPYKYQNLFLTCQMEVHGVFPTSLEESIILENHDSKILHNAYRMTKPNIYKREVNNCDDNFKNKSRMLHNKLKDEKSDFAQNILLELLDDENDKSKFNIPNYIEVGLKWLEEKLKEV